MPMKQYIRKLVSPPSKPNVLQNTDWYGIISEGTDMILFEEKYIKKIQRLVHVPALKVVNNCFTRVLSTPVSSL